jgi:hypothetical protein
MAAVEVVPLPTVAAAVMLCFAAAALDTGDRLLLVANACATTAPLPATGKAPNAGDMGGKDGWLVASVSGGNRPNGQLNQDVTENVLGTATFQR